MSSDPESVRLRRTVRRRPARRRIRVRRILAAVVLVALVPVLYSYVSTMLQPSSLPLGIRTVEWIRANGGAWFVNDAESIYYRWQAPKKGGPTLKALPKVGARAVAPTALRPHAVRRAVVVEPTRIRPLIAPRLPGEGVWHTVGPLVQGRPPLLVTTFRSDPQYPQLVAYVAWINHAAAQLALYPGRYEPPSGTPRGPMQVPYGERWRLLGTFNSGFTYRDGHGGFAVDGHVYEPLQRGLATLVGYRDGGVDVVTWRGGAAPGRKVAFARQNLPLIVAGGRPTPNLSDGPQWGATLGNAIRVWRSGIGVDRHGNLIYAAADFQTVSSLAQILIHAGAVRAMELDINSEWPTFITYGRSGGRDPSKLVPNPQQPPSRYLSPDDRDFFAILRRTPGPVSVPFS